MIPEAPGLGLVEQVLARAAWSCRLVCRNRPGLMSIVTRVENAASLYAPH